MTVRSRIGALLIAALTASPASAQSNAAPLRLEPRTEWVLDYAEERCSLHLGFGEGEHSLNLRIDWFGPRSHFRFLVVGPAVPKLAGPWSNLRHRFTPDADHREGMGINGTYRDLPAVSFGSSFLAVEPDTAWERLSTAERNERSAVPVPPQPQFETQVRTLELRFGDGTELVLALGNMAKPLGAMRGCMDNLVSVWGLDPAVQNTLTRLAVPKPSTIRRVQRRFPFTELAKGTNAFVPVRVMLDASGNVTACIVQSEGIDESFTDAVCKSLAHGYEPARNANGDPVASVYPTSVIYMAN